MNRLFVAAFLLLATAIMGTAPSAAAQNGRKVIKDTAEYNAYLAAFNTQDPAAKAAAMEAFIQKYPQSVVLSDALEQAMAAYQQAGNQAKVLDTGQRIIAIDPGNVRALAILAFLKRAAGTAETAKEAQAYAERGLAGLSKWTLPEGTSDADFQKLRMQMSLIFYGAAGWGHLQAKEFDVARDNYLKALQIDPTDFQNTFQLGYALLESDPIDLRGLWYAVKAANLAQAAGNAAGVKQILDYAKAKYRKYHGSNDGWDAFAASVAAQNALPPPADLAKAITRAPTVCEIAVQAVQENDPGTLSFGDWEFILSKANCSPANKQAADKVWQTVLAKQKNGDAEVKLKLVGLKVIAANKDSIDAALTDENQASMNADVHIIMEEPIPPPARGSTKSNIPVPGSTIDIIGVLTSYTADPFMFTMTKGALPEAAKPAPTAHPPVRKKAP
jgi:tetratricopeptide (TPR) repeat protein